MIACPSLPGRAQTSISKSNPINLHINLVEELKKQIADSELDYALELIRGMLEENHTGSKL